MRPVLVLLIIMLFEYTDLFSQHKILNIDTNEPLEYANVLFLRGDSIVGGAYTTSAGLINIPSSQGIDKLHISHITCNSLVTPFPTASDSLYLTSKKIVLNEVNAIAAKHPEKFYFGAKPSWLSGSVAPTGGMEIVTLIRNSVERPITINGVKFFIRTEEGYISNKIRTLGYANEGGYPGERVLFDTIMTLTANNKRRLEIDVVGVNWKIPTDGIFLGFEWIGNPDLEFTDRNLGKTGPLIAWKINVSDSTDDSRKTFIRMKLRNPEWQRIEESFNGHFGDKQINPLLIIQGNY